MADDIGAAVRAILLADEAVAALVDKRIYGDALRQGIPLPAIVVKVSEDTPVHHQGGRSALAEAIVTVEFYAGKRTDANAGGKACRLALDRYQGTSEGTVIRQLISGERDELYDLPEADEGYGRFIDEREYRAFYRDEAA